MKRFTKQIGIMVTPEMDEELRAAIEADEVSMNTWIRDAIRTKLEKQSTKPWWPSETRAAMQEYHNKEGVQG